MAQLAERSFITSENSGSNPDIGNFKWTFIYCNGKLNSLIVMNGADRGHKQQVQDF